MSHLIRHYKRLKECAQIAGVSLFEKNVPSHKNIFLWSFLPLCEAIFLAFKQIHTLCLLFIRTYLTLDYFCLCKRKENLRQESSKQPVITRADTICAQTRSVISCVWRRLCEVLAWAHLPPRRQRSHLLWCDSVQLSAYDSSDHAFLSLYINGMTIIITYLLSWQPGCY